MVEYQTAQPVDYFSIQQRADIGASGKTGNLENSVWNDGSEWSDGSWSDGGGWENSSWSDSGWSND